MTRTLDAEGLSKTMPDAIITFTGRWIRPLHPDPADICIEDIAHSLSMQPRFTGHLRQFSSVAEHCVRTALLAPDELKLEALLHDASEAYLADIARPVKKAPEFAVYLKYEARLERAIQIAFQLPLRDEMEPEIKRLDQYTLEAEVAAFAHESLQEAMGVSREDDWQHGSWPSGWSPQVAEARFLDDFGAYWAAREALKAVRL